jgi:predicted ATPase
MPAGGAEAAQEQAEAVIALCSEQGFAFYLAEGTIMRGWALAVQGQGKEGIAQIRQGIADYRATGAEVHLPYCLALLAEAYGKVGRAEEGLSVLAEALAAVDKTGERYYEAEIYRLKGQLTLQKLSVASSQLSATNPQPLTPNTQAEVEREAKECFLKAIEIARKQQAKSLELRATTSLVRLRQQQALEQGARSREQRAENRKREARAKLDEAHTMLADVYNWFTEGFDTKDLQEARALIEELSH